MTDQPQDYAKWVEEIIPPTWYFPVADFCAHIVAPHNVGASFIIDNKAVFVPHAALSEIARLKAALEAREKVARLAKAALAQNGPCMCQNDSYDPWECQKCSARKALYSALAFLEVR